MHPSQEYLVAWLPAPIHRVSFLVRRLETRRGVGRPPGRPCLAVDPRHGSFRCFPGCQTGGTGTSIAAPPDLRAPNPVRAARERATGRRSAAGRGSAGDPDWPRRFASSDGHHPGIARPRPPGYRRRRSGGSEATGPIGCHAGPVDLPEHAVGASAGRRGVNKMGTTLAAVCRSRAGSAGSALGQSFRADGARQPGLRFGRLAAGWRLMRSPAAGSAGEARARRRDHPTGGDLGGTGDGTTLPSRSPLLESRWPKAFSARDPSIEPRSSRFARETNSDARQGPPVSLDYREEGQPACSPSPPVFGRLVHRGYAPAGLRDDASELPRRRLSGERPSEAPRSANWRRGRGGEPEKP